MKFTQAWVEVLNQNDALKITLAISTICTFVLCITVVRLALRDPLVIDRECFSRTLQPAQTNQTPVEIENFVRSSLAKRFDSDAVDPRSYMEEEEYAYRLKEQEDLSRKGMRQKVIPSSVKVTDKEVIVEADRILSVGNIRSNVPFVLSVRLAATSRTTANPYGLVFQKVTQLTKEESKP